MLYNLKACIEGMPSEHSWGVLGLIGVPRLLWVGPSGTLDNKKLTRKPKVCTIVAFPAGRLRVALAGVIPLLGRLYSGSLYLADF